MLINTNELGIFDSISQDRLNFKVQNEVLVQVL